MTLQNGLLTEGAAYLWTDTAFYQDSEVKGHLPKIGTVEDLNCAYVHSGTIGGMGALQDNIAFHRPKTYMELERLVQATLGQFVQSPFQQSALIAAFDGRPRLTLIGTEYQTDHAPLTAIPVSHYICSSEDDPFIIAEEKRGLTPDAMPYVIRAQHLDHGREKSALFSGHIMQAKVSAAGLETDTVDFLPDQNSDQFRDMRRIQEITRAKAKGEEAA